MSLTHEQRRAIRRELAEFSATHTDAETAHKFGRCDKAIKDARREFGIKKQTYLVRPPSPSTIRVLARLLAGESQSDIARDLGVARQWVHAVYKSAVSKGIVFNLKKRRSS